MAECKTCGKQYHACSSCGLADWEWNYCSEECRHGSPEMDKITKLLRPLYEGNPRAFFDLANALSTWEIELDDLEYYLENFLEKYGFIQETTMPSEE